MKLIVGQGNPGEKYNWTRHNFGFLALDFYAKVHGLEWEKEKMGARWARDGERILVQPQTFYNETGLSVQQWLHYYKLGAEDLLVVADDFNLPFGALRYRAKGSSGGNRGLMSIEQMIGTSEFGRLRLGTDNPELRQRMGDVDFVLGRWTAKEKAALVGILEQAEQFLRGQ